MQLEGVWPHTTGINMILIWPCRALMTFLHWTSISSSRLHCLILFPSVHHLKINNNKTAEPAENCVAIKPLFPRWACSCAVVWTPAFWSRGESCIMPLLSIGDVFAFTLMLNLVTMHLRPPFGRSAHKPSSIIFGKYYTISIQSQKTNCNARWGF